MGGDVLKDNELASFFGQIDEVEDEDCYEHYSH